ncbi:MAG TPA: hypothetical protein VNS22_18125 [Geminicoccus sp.]|nr:hypothetical protein [Geminicoccus sp.]HWL70277.1 hypothetical protein [Geminicoccus sp.]
MRAFALLVALALPLALGACGKKGALEIPPEEPDQAETGSAG